MKLGSQTGSLTNHLYSRMVIGQPQPTVGMGGTVCGWTDRYATTIIEVFTIGRSVYIKAQEDFAKRSDDNGMSECQEYTYSPNPEGSVHTFKRESDGRWSEVYKNQETGRYKKYNGGKGFRLGVRQKYHDYSF